MKSVISFSVLIASVAGYAVYLLMNKVTETLSAVSSITF